MNIMCLVVCMGSVFAAGCACVHTEVMEPRAVIQEYADHVLAARHERALALLSDRTRKRLDLKSLKQYLEYAGEPLKVSLQKLVTASSSEMELWAVFKNKHGLEVILVKQPEGWKLETGDVVPGPGASPQAVVEAFLGAVENNDCDILLDCAPPEVWRGMDSEKLLEGCRARMKTLRKVADLIRSSQPVPVMVTDQKAELVYQDDRKMILVRQGRRWYLEDLWH